MFAYPRLLDALRGDVCFEKRSADLAAGRANVDDSSWVTLPLPVCSQQWGKGLRHRKRGDQVYLKLSAIILQREVKERTVYRDSCIIDQTRQRIGTKLFLDLESGPIHTLPV